MNLGCRVLPGLRLGESGVQTHTHARPCVRVRPLVPGQRVLGFDAGAQRGVGVRERRENGVTLGEQCHAVTRAQGAPEYQPVLGQHRPVFGAEHLG